MNTTPTRLTAEEFLEKIESASSYAIIMNERLEEMELLIRDGGEVVGYLGPDPETTKPKKLVKFLEKLEVIVKQDSGKAL